MTHITSKNFHLSDSPATYYNSQFACLFVCLFVCLSGNYSQIIGPKGLKFSGFDGGHPGGIIKKFGEDQIIPYLWGYFPPKISWLWSQLYALVNHPTYYNYVNTYVSKTVPKPLPDLVLHFFSL